MNFNPGDVLKTPNYYCMVLGIHDDHYIIKFFDDRDNGSYSYILIKTVNKFCDLVSSSMREEL